MAAYSKISVKHQAPISRTKGQGVRAFVVSAIGTSLQWYDFAIYSAASALIFGKVFFPSSDALAGTLLAFATYAVGYAARPIGGIVFGLLGDVVGRKNVLVWTLLLIGISMLGVGLIPIYASIGIWPPLALVLLRLCQGGVCGEWAGAPRKRGLTGSAAQIGPPIGNLLANGVLAILAASLTSEDFLAWGWRLAFLLSAALAAFGLWIQLRIEETPVCEEIKKKGLVSKAPLKEVFTHEFKAHVAATLVRICPDVICGMSTVFVLTYLLGKYGTWQPLAAYIVLVTIVTLLGVRLARDPDHDEVLEPATGDGVLLVASRQARSLP